ncbi:hypothetical protein [Litorihabitans aurantiacus]|uniref:Uncharacterized protein n=1 Tax=Litorihabitans aurantiacus TaxID=1930061 RepID=A0AA37XI06_9MICO|nr:hypothetical protein [Litorihabitans aurantiacus]GMA33409.1 hypothetical protein GCM10025875_34010 [Litorihabitans aurantiacus]
MPLLSPQTAVPAPTRTPRRASFRGPQARTTAVRSAVALMLATVLGAGFALLAPAAALAAPATADGATATPAPPVSPRRTPRRSRTALSSSSA